MGPYVWRVQKLFIAGVLVHDRPGEKREAHAVSTVVNLRTARKRKQRKDKENAAAENRVKFGRTKAERNVTDLEANRAERNLDGKRRTEPDPASDS